MNNVKFIQMCKMSQGKLKKYVTNELKSTHTDITVADGFVYAQGTFPVLLVAHLDTVHKNLPGLIEYNAETNSVSSPNGIGGDDRCGVYMILEIIKKFNCSVLFCEDEEIGTIGASKFTKTDLARKVTFNYIIEFDRRGSNDAVFYDCANDDFEEFITKEFYQTALGIYSDISVIAPFLGVAAVNLSCGYYGAHTLHEYVMLEEMEASMEAACKILERTTEEDKFEYIEDPNSYGNWCSSNWYGGNWYGKGYQTNYDYRYTENYDSWSKYTGNNYYIIEYVSENGTTEWFECYANSEPEVIGKFLMIHKYLTYDDIIDICYDSSSDK